MKTQHPTINKEQIHKLTNQTSNDTMKILKQLTNNGTIAYKLWKSGKFGVAAWRPVSWHLASVTHESFFWHAFQESEKGFSNQNKTNVKIDNEEISAKF